MEINISLSGALRIVSVSEVAPADLVAFRNQSNKESEHVNRMTLREAADWVADSADFHLLMRDDTIVGQLVLDVVEAPPDLYIDLISVLNSEKGRGGASMLIAYAIKEAKAIGCKTVSLAVHKSNARAVQFYEKQGFVKIKRLSKDAFLYSKHIGGL